jgi:hypothetical protein
MMEQKVIQDMVTAITPELWMLFIRMIMTVVGTLIVYQLLRNVAAYIILRFDKEFGKNIKVRYGDQNAIVCDVNVRRLVLRLENGNEVLIPITKVSQTSWELVRNGNGGKIQC